MGALSNKPLKLNARLSPTRVKSLLERLRSQERKVPDDSRKGGARHHYRPGSNIVVSVFDDSGKQVRYAVVARNLSATGLSFLHGAYVHVDAKCAATLETAERKWVRILGTVVRCRHVEANVHEVGVRFFDPVDIDTFVTGATPSEVPPLLRTLVPKLTGQALYIDDNVDDRELMRFLLGCIGVKAVVTSSGDEGLALIDSKLPIDVVICDHHSQGVNGLEFLKAIRQRENALPVILTAVDADASLRREAMDAGCETLLPKPFQLDQVASVLLHHLPMSESEPESQDGPIHSTLWPDRDMQPLILNFLSRLETHIEKVTKAMANNRSTAMSMLVRLKGTAGGYGFPQITHAIQRIISLDAAGAPGEQWSKHIEHAMQLCRRACEVRRQCES